MNKMWCISNIGQNMHMFWDNVSTPTPFLPCMNHTTHLHHYAIASFLITSNPWKLFSNDVSHIPIGGDLIILSYILMVENQIVCLTIEVIHLAKSPNGEFNLTLIFTLQDVSGNLKRAQFEQCLIPQTFFESCGTL